MFDPYRTWLGIPPDRRPPTHYDLLGVDEAETDLEVIKNAHLMRMGHLRKFQNGPSGDECIRLIRELSAAAEVLSDPGQRKLYRWSTRSTTADSSLVANPLADRENAAEESAIRPRQNPRPVAVSSRRRSIVLFVGTSTCLVLAIIVLAAWLAMPSQTNRNNADLSFTPKSMASFDKEITNSIGMTFVLILPGTFEMGSNQEEADRANSAVRSARKEWPNEWFDHREVPRHTIRIGKAFYLGKYEVSQAEWVKMMGTHPWSDNPHVRKGKAYPASMICWDEAVAFCWWLTHRERASGHLSPTDEYRLPTEAEWEYACRAGTKTSYSFGDDIEALLEYSWFERNTQDRNEQYAHEVGKKKPNPWGLYDMHGNVWEWCSDWFRKDYYAYSPKDNPDGPSIGGSRVFRGGSFRDPPFWGIRSASRGERPPNARHYNVGFRVVRTIVDPE